MSNAGSFSRSLVISVQLATEMCLLKCVCLGHTEDGKRFRLRLEPTERNYDVINEHQPLLAASASQQQRRR